VFGMTAIIARHWKSIKLFVGHYSSFDGELNCAIALIAEAP